MRINKFILAAATFSTIAIAVIVFLFDYISSHYDRSVMDITVLFTISTLLIFIINLFLADTVFRFYGKRQVKKIASNLPPEFKDSQNMGIKELGEKIQIINEQNISEIDTMKEMETYRKEYIGNVSHELKTPLFSIQGYIETLRDGAVENLNIRDKYLERIGISVERLIEIVQDLDMINRFESGEIILNITRFDINQTAREVFDLLDLEAQKKNATLQLESPQNQIFVRADQQKITQVLINLVSNAIHYANRQQPKIVIRTNVLINKIFVEVEDNGMGIKPEILPRIFERFYRVESSRNRSEGGSGLGLAIVKHILEAHNENILVESVYLEGTKFSFLLQKG